MVKVKVKVRFVLKIHKKIYFCNYRTKLKEYISLGPKAPKLNGAKGPKTYFCQNSSVVRRKTGQNL